MIQFIKKLFAKLKFEESNQNRGGDFRDLYVGKKIGHRDVQGEVVELLSKGGFRVKITKLDNPHFNSYLDLGKIYPVYWHRHTGPKGIPGCHKHFVYEISPKHLKRNSSQLLLYCWNDTGWDWELDF